MENEKMFFECKSCWSNGYIKIKEDGSIPTCPVCGSKQLTLSASEAEHMKKLGLY